LTAKPGKRAS